MTATKDEKKANCETLRSHRERYMEHKTSHQDYYLWLSDWIGLTDGLIPFSNEQVRASKDEHLNDLPLAHWDRMDGSARQKAYAMGLPWSLSDTVCCLKAMAKRRAGQ